MSRIMPAVLAACFALHHAHCVAKRNSPFPGPFRYEARELPLTRMLTVTAAAAGAHGGSLAGNRNEGWVKREQEKETFDAGEGCFARFSWFGRL